MSLSTEENNLVFNSDQDKAIYWENRSKDLEAQVKKLQRKRKCSLEDDQDVNPAKKLRVEDMDPLLKFPDHCTQMILNHFNGVDLYKMTKVSRDWKMVVECDPKAAYILEKALTLNVRGDTVKEKVCLKLLSDVKGYKHLTVESNILGTTCLSRFSSTIKTLNIYLSNTNDISFQPLSINFPHLKSLRVVSPSSNLLEWFSKCKFPVLSELILTIDDGNGYFRVVNCDNMKQTLAAMPNLKHLDSEHIFFEMEPFKEELSKLESLKVLFFDDQIIKVFSTSTLKSLDLAIINDKEMGNFLSKMKNVKNLAISVYDSDREEPLPEMTTNTSILSFDVNFRNLYKDDLTVIQILKALPSLEKFRHNVELLFSTLLVIMHDNLKMKKIFCKSVSDETLKQYEELKLKEADNDQVNTGIEIVDSSLWWMDI